MNNDEHLHIISYKTLIKVLLSLLTLTFITVYVAYLDLGLLATTVAMLIASIKATIVLLYFMHLKFDKKIFGVLVGLVIVLFIVFMTLIFIDYFNR